MRNPIAKISLKNIAKVDLTRKISTHLVGEDHNIKHRMSVGGVIILIGVVISEIPATYGVLHIVYDAVGYGIHGIGLLPYGEHFLSKVKAYTTDQTAEIEHLKLMLQKIQEESEKNQVIEQETEEIIK